MGNKFHAERPCISRQVQLGQRLVIAAGRRENVDIPIVEPAGPVRRPGKVQRMTVRDAYANPPAQGTLGRQRPAAPGAQE